MRLTLNCRCVLFFTKLTSLNLYKCHTEEGRTAKENFRHLRNKLQEETYLCAFPSWEPSNVEAF